MASFTDRTGRTWNLALTLGDVKKIRADHGVGLGSRDDVKALTALGCDPFKLGAVLWTLCESQADGMTPEQFADQFDGDALESALDALVAASIKLQPEHFRRVLRKAFDEAKDAEVQAAAATVKWFDDNRDLIAAKVDDSVSKHLRKVTA